MYFSITAEHSHGDKYFRLKKDGTWKLQEDYQLVDFNEDLLFTDINEAQRWLEANNEVIIEGETHEVSPEIYVLGEERYYFETICHRISKPKHLFTFEEFITAIETADDNFYNSLQINFDGEVVVQPVIDVTPVSLYDYAVREETFNAQNGYVGKIEGIREDEFYRDLYLSSLEGWLDHLTYGKSVYRGEEHASLSEEELLEKLQKFYN